MFWQVMRSVSTKHVAGQMIEAFDDGSVEIDMGYGNVRVNPKFVSWLCVAPLQIEAPKDAQPAQEQTQEEGPKMETLTDFDRGILSAARISHLGESL